MSGWRREVETGRRVYGTFTVKPCPQLKSYEGMNLYINSLAFSPDGNWLATASGDKTSILWDLKANDPAANPGILRGHDQQVFRLAFSPDGGWLATGSGDASVRLWDMRSAFPAKSKEILWGHSELGQHLSL